MKKSRVSALVCAFALVSAGCASVTVEAPAGQPIRMASAGRETPNVISVKRWYMFWGLLPLGDPTIAQDIADSKMKVVRVRVYMGVDDFLLAATLGIIPVVPVPRTIEIQGE